MGYVVNLLAALGLFYSGFVHTFWGRSVSWLGHYDNRGPHIGGAFAGGHGASRIHRSAPALGRYWYIFIGVVGVARGWGASREDPNDAG